ncbi:MAG: hypothetical protein RLZZ326_2561 [Planctomycetota bacterium]|jgi:hypothetical protein
MDTAKATKSQPALIKSGQEQTNPPGSVTISLLRMVVNQPDHGEAASFRICGPA